MKFQKLISSSVLAVLLLNPLMASAAACKKPQIRSAFSNGIQNTRDQALASHEKLMMKTASAGFAEKILLYHAKGRDHNQPGRLSFALDMFEVFALLSKESIAGNPANEKLASKIAGGYRSPESKPSTTYLQLVGFFDGARDKVETLAFQQNTPDNLRVTVANDALTLTTWLKLGNLVMVSAHSQGTLWANAALARVESEQPLLAKQVRLVSAGMAASKVWQTPGSALASSYVTNTSDLVIGTLRSVAGAAGLPLPMPSNSTHSFIFSEPQGHGFDKVYLNEAEQTGADFLKLHSAGVAKLQDDNRMTPLASYEATVDVGPTGAPHLAVNSILGKVYGNSSPASDLNGFAYIVQNVRTGASTLKSGVSWFCDANQRPPVVGSSIELVLTLPTFYGKPALIDGSAQLESKPYTVERLGDGTGYPGGTTNWRVGKVTFVSSPTGPVPTLVME